MSERPLRVIQLLPSLESGGAERSAQEIGRALVAGGHRSIVISGGGRMVDQLRAEGSEHIEMPIGRKSLFALRQIIPLRRVFADVQPDIVHARSRLPAWLGCWALGAAGPQVHFVTTVHGLNSPSRYSAIMARGERAICVSRSVREHVLQHYPRTNPARLPIIPRGVDEDEFPFGYQADADWREKFFREFPQLAGAPLLTLPGRGTRLKGHADAITLLADLAKRGLDARLLLLGAREAGRETYVSELEAIANRLGVADKIAISAMRSDVRDVYAISTLILQLSTRPESFGRTVIEALSLGRPVLGYAHGGVGDLLDEGYPAGCVAVGDRGALAERAATLIASAPPVAPLHGYRLADMQQRTLDLYAELASS